MSSPPTPDTMPAGSISPEALAAAAERRTRLLPQQPSAAQMAAEHEQRQKFRRLVDPGILRPNSKEQAMASLQTLLTISENLLREPDNPKFQQFKPTNNIIKRNLMDPKGTLEYAIELGFRPEVKNFQPFYTFNNRHLPQLRIGAGILKDFIDLETEKVERAARAKQNEKAVAESVASKVKLAYMDDRKTKMLRDEMEKEQRVARAAAALHRAQLQETSPSIPLALSRSPSPTENMPGSGHVLGPPDGPPPYEPEN
ncbi:hypothetical protein BDQ12DRAFT_718716 [Crucibulum laeve]|uniref:PUB domain-containing protein n=1 Tax=Crucibulum laeve TaxID=68775 RepID=A0A5C3MDG2_9AGAR|nr:hypothetical protein BDQ12DRAFT_718716 [Crucibulum laeve]